MDPVSILKDLIAIPSVNPMGRDVAGPEFFETRLTQYLVGVFHALGVEYEEIEVTPGRANVVAKFDSPGAKTTVMLDAHQDTVPVDNMTIDPFDPVERDGRIYGRGASDVKGGMAAMLAAFTRLVKEKPSGAANVVMSCTCDEEATVTGIEHLAAMLNGEGGSSKVLSTKPDVAIIAEPTDLNVVVAHRGATRWKIQTRGRACHSSKPSDGVNAIYRMGRLLTVLEEYADRLEELVPPHHLCGPATLSVGRIEGGAGANTVPDSCTIEIDRRCIPGEDPKDVPNQVAAYLRERLDFHFEMHEPWLFALTLDDGDNLPLAEELMQHIAAVAGPRETVGVPYGTHASRVHQAGVPSVVFGPGSIAQAHTKDEWIPVDELRQAAEVYYRFCAAGG